MSQTIVFVHGGWVTPACWDPFVTYFESRGHRCLARVRATSRSKE